VVNHCFVFEKAFWPSFC
jgi:hypothetical protein